MVERTMQASDLSGRCRNLAGRMGWLDTVVRHTVVMAGPFEGRTLLEAEVVTHPEEPEELLSAAAGAIDDLGAQLIDALVTVKVLESGVALDELDGKMRQRVQRVLDVVDPDRGVDLDEPFVSTA